MNRFAPILLFVFNRPDHTEQTLKALKANTLAKHSHLIVYSDAPRSASDEPRVKQVRHIVHQAEGFQSVTVIERTENWGLARSIIDGVTTQLAVHGRVIVLEDDLITAPHFLQFMNEALELYRDEPRVGHVYACDFTNDPTLPETFLLKWTGSWGWGTWDRAWKLFNPNGQELLNQLQERKLTHTFDFNGRYGFTRMLRRQIARKNNSWAIRWNASLFLANVLSLCVGRSLVQNIGFDNSGTNCGGGNLYYSNLYPKAINVNKIDPIEENLIARKALERYYFRTNNFFAKAWRRIRRTIRGDFKR